MCQYPELTGLEGDVLDSGPVAELARVAEDAGWDGFAFTDRRSRSGSAATPS